MNEPVVTEADEKAADAVIDWWCTDGRLRRLAPAELVPIIAQAIARARSEENIACEAIARAAGRDWVADCIATRRSP